MLVYLSFISNSFYTSILLRKRTYLVKNYLGKDSATNVSTLSYTKSSNIKLRKLCQKIVFQMLQPSSTRISQFYLDKCLTLYNSYHHCILQISLLTHFQFRERVVSGPRVSPDTQDHDHCTEHRPEYQGQKR